MFLRRFAENIKKQSWEALLLEFLIVVVGVFVAIQADTWNKARIDRKDESLFLLRLHDDLELAEQLSERVRTSRLGRSKLLISSAEILFQRGDRNFLKTEECTAISASHHMGISTAELTSFNEIVQSGRLGIIQNNELRGLLISYNQLVANVQRIQLSPRNNLLRLYPELIEVDVAPNTNHGVNFESRCNLDGMRQDRGFLNAFTENTDIYDAFLSDALLPWHLHLEELHELVDAELKLSHE